MATSLRSLGCCRFRQRASATQIVLAEPAAQWQQQQQQQQQRYIPSCIFKPQQKRHQSSGQNAQANVLDILSLRGMVHQITAPNSLRQHLTNDDKTPSRTIYTGVDPSADSLHVGNLLPLFAALHFIRHGHTAIILIGGATGMIGDPTGRSSERQALDHAQLAHNVSMITQQVQHFFERAAQFATKRGDNALTKEIVSSRLRFVNNASFYEQMNVLTFLRDVGKYARVSSMLARDSVKSRLHPDQSGPPLTSSTPGLSFTEFSYQLLQAYDFSILHGEPWSCTVQIGGSDQMGNIMAGVDLIRRQKALASSRFDESDTKEGRCATSTSDKEEQGPQPAYGLTLPLLTTSSGAKFGKSAGNAVWLDAQKCSHYDFYQYFYRARDEDVRTYLQTLTLMTNEEIDTIMQTHSAAPAQRTAQRALANHITELVRGSEALHQARVATRVLFETALEGLTTQDVCLAFEGDARLHRLANEDVDDVDVLHLAKRVGLTRSRSEARRACIGGGLYVNNVAVRDPLLRLSRSHLISGTNVVILRLGSKEHAIIVVGSSY